MIAAGAATGTTVYAMVRARAESGPDRPALTGEGMTLTYRALIARVDAVAADLARRGIRRGDRVAVLSENRVSYTLVQLAAARLGAIVACQNWRLSPPELRHCIALVDPALMIASDRYRALAEGCWAGEVLPIDAMGADGDSPAAAEPEDPLLIIYTSGTTGLPKAAAISHRAEVARMCATRLDIGITADDGYISWAPMFHMGGTEHLLAVLMSGGHGFVVDGFDADAICDIVAAHPIGWLMLVPATIAPVVERLRARGIRPRRLRAVGCMADLVPGQELAAITRATDTPYLDSFGATETGMGPLSAGRVPVGMAPAALPKQLSPLAELRLVGPDGRDVPDGEVGEAWTRGPTLFSGYWNAPEATAASFAEGGWYRMGDLFRRGPDGYHFVGRSKYLIKSGGENIYPAEIERVLLDDARVIDAVAVRAADPRWGEVVAAVIARRDPSLDEAEVERLCRASLAGYKRPRIVLFVENDDLPRNVSGKIMREAVESLVVARTA
ncbi:fatty-acyl-CoA synthase [Sphingomonas jejuensis]|uniref:Fatty-acyl-CoA synthase n=1 Tax=Sphingomonas jejuensis TaxID=904715 RepID=A0ABX0XHT6_9SPHN|nr:class I adenylate-forming enzyme family protein [Sphingomonas jejuensis]NJC32893.1 fatty-acyl-CoA synthase [Sphingomonas jejuensis]